MAGVIAKGDAVIAINPLQTEARLVFTPNADGLGWDADAVNKLAGELKLHPPINPKILEPFLSKAGRSKTPMELVLYQGILPEDPVSESFGWEELPVPPEYESFSEEAKAAVPELYRIRTERIKNEKTVKKPGALPFLPAREEVVVSWDKKETREKAAVNPEIKELKYAEKGQKIATIYHSSPGKPGKSVFGRPLPPAHPETENILLGSGILREKNDLTAAATGFVRIGENWADLFPLHKSEWTVNTGMDGITLFFSFTPGDPRFPVPAAHEIISAAIEKGVSESALVNAKTLDEAIKGAAKSGKPLLAFPLMIAKEAAAAVVINPDKTLATLNLRKGTAGHNPLDMKAISAALKESGVHIADAEKLKAAIHAFMSGKDLELDYVLAEGKPASRGSDREVSLSVQLLEDQEQLLARLKTGRNRFLEGSFSPDEITGLALAEKGAEVARVQAPSEGEAGYDIYGNVIPAMPGNDPQLRLFRGFEQHGEIIRAQKTGLLAVHQAEHSFWADLIDYEDAKIEIKISEDKMEVRADLFRETGPGIPLTVNAVLKALADQGITHGIDGKAVEAACAAARSRGSSLNAVLASGEAPVRAGARPVKWFVPTSGKAQVKAATIIAEFSGILENGRPGCNVAGEEIAADLGPDSEIGHDGSISETAVAECIRFTALKPGELNFDGTNLTIESLRQIEGDVGKTTGNIDFTGEVVVQGKVSAGYSVIGGLDVSIGGIAEEALVSSGGSVKVSGGIRGGGKAVIRARSAIEAPFAEKATLMAVGDIRLDRGASLCIIKTNGVLTVKNADGRLQGGSCQARYGADLASLGSVTGGHTEISFGQDYLIKDQIGETEEEISKAKTILGSIENKITEAKKDTEIFERIRNEKIRILKILEQLKLRLFTLQEKFEEHYDSEVKIRGIVYPGVVVESHSRYYEVQQARRAVVFYFDRNSGRIMEKSI